MLLSPSRRYIGAMVAADASALVLPAVPTDPAAAPIGFIAFAKTNWPAVDPAVPVAPGVALGLDAFLWMQPSSVTLSAFAAALGAG